MASCSIVHLENLCKRKHFNEALAVAWSMHQEGKCLPRDIIYSLLQGHGGSKDLRSARKLHSLMVYNNLDGIPVLADHLIRLFAFCGCLADAQQAFSRVSKPSVYTWNAILTAHSKQGHIDIVLELFYRMLQSGLKPDRVTVLLVLKACGDAGSAQKGRLIHIWIVRSHMAFDLILGSTLVDMYAKCSELKDAKKMFDGMPGRDTVAWGAMIAGYAQHEDGLSTLQLFANMQAEGVFLNEVIFPSVLKAIGLAMAIKDGRISHSQIVELGVERDLVVISSLTDMYSRCKSIEDAKHLFDNVLCRDTVLWGTMVSGYSWCGLYQSALDTFKNMLAEGLNPSKPMLLCVMKAASSLHALAAGMVLHDLVVRIGWEQDTMLGNALIDVYAKLAALNEAQRTFNCMQTQDFVSWATLMSGFEAQGDCKAVIDLFTKMLENGVLPDRVTIVFALKACSGLRNLEQGKTLHRRLDSWGVEVDVFVSNALIDMYSKCGSMEEARAIFNGLKIRDEVSWGAIISGYADGVDPLAALELVCEMLEDGQKLGKVVLISAMKACIDLSALSDGRLLHDQSVSSGLGCDGDIGCTLVNMYSKCGCLEDATSVFNAMQYHDLPSWTSMILGHTGRANSTACELFEQMQEEGIAFNAPILLSIVNSCGGIRDVAQGRIIHHQILKYGLTENAAVMNLLIGMYAKCQSIMEARKVFDTFKDRNEMTWGYIIAAYIHNGDEAVPLDVFKQSEGLILGCQMLISILKACGSSSALKQGRICHFLVLETGLELDTMIGNTLISMYAKCRSPHEALKTFSQLPFYDLVTYSTMITGLVEFDEYFHALELYVRLQEEGLKVDKHVQQCMLNICGTLNFLKLGRQIHSDLVKDELDSDAAVRSALIHMYTNCASSEEAGKVLDQSCTQDIILWGAVITGCTRNGDIERVLQFIEDMFIRGLKPTKRMFSSILAACSHVGALLEGNRCFQTMMEKHTPSIEHLNCMIDLFGRTGHLGVATDLLTAMPIDPDMVSFKSFLTGCQKYGFLDLERECFDKTAAWEPNRVSVLGEASLKDVERYKGWKPSGDFCRHAQAGPDDTDYSSHDTHVYKVHHFCTNYENPFLDVKRFLPKSNECKDDHLPVHSQTIPLNCLPHYKDHPIQKVCSLHERICLDFSLQSCFEECQASY